MNNVRSTLLFYVIGWIIGYNLLGIPVYFFMQGMEACQEEWVNAAFWPGVLTNVMAGIMMGLLLGFVDLLLERLIKRKLSFLNWFLIRCAIYTGAFLGLGMMTQVSLRTLSSGNLQESVELTAGGGGFNILFGYLIFSVIYSVLLSFVNQLRRLLRPGILLPLFLGRYFKPQLEQRIFLFLDLRSSTALTERLGNLKYSQLIQDCIYDLDRLVTKYAADIYQYVGDEVVLTWTLKGGLSNNKCVNLVLAFQKALESRSEYYMREYGTLPVFKGGLSHGEVTVTEIGNTKKEICYYGDVLNRAARLQGLCNSLGSKLIADQKLVERLDREALEMLVDIGSHTLKGIDEPVHLYNLLN